VRAPWFFWVAALTATATWAACTASSSSGLGGEEGVGAQGNNMPLAGAGGVIFDLDSGPQCETHCSGDLHSLLDCNDVVVSQCPPDQGCSPNGGCVPACQAATENASTFGCDFYSVTPACISEARGGCFAVLVSNTWSAPIDITAEYGGVPLAGQYKYVPVGQGASLTYQPLAGQLPPGQLAILFLSQYPSGDIYQVNCPVTPAMTTSTQLDTTGMSQSFRITTTAPVVAYDVYPWGGSTSYVTSATLLVPTPTWGTNFVTADAWEAGHGNPFTQVVAAEDGTTVTMVPIANVDGGGGLPAMAANTPTPFTLNRGQVAQFLQPTRLAGSVLSSDKPISVWGGSTCMEIPNGVDACDAAHQQLVPVQMLGNEYVAARYPSRGGDDMAPYTMVGMVDGTQFWFDPMPAGAPATLNRGQMAIFYTDQPFLVSSQDADHPFYMAAHMTGGMKANDLGDPEYVNLVPPRQYLAYYLFATDPTYNNTALVFVRQKGKDQLFHDVNLACLGVVPDWQPVGSSGNYQVARIMMVNAGVGLGGCNNGVQMATSAVPFGLYVWGYDPYASYGYPGGMSVAPINQVVVPPTPR
jgi:hypothetical protein